MNVDSWLFYKWGKQNTNEEEQREDKTGENYSGEKKRWEEIH